MDNQKIHSTSKITFAWFDHPQYRLITQWPSVGFWTSFKKKQIFEWVLSFLQLFRLREELLLGLKPPNLDRQLSCVFARNGHFGEGKTLRITVTLGLDSLITSNHHQPPIQVVVLVPWKTPVLRRWESQVKLHSSWSSSIINMWQLWVPKTIDFWKNKNQELKPHLVERSHIFTFQLTLTLCLKIYFGDQWLTSVVFNFITQHISHQSPNITQHDRRQHDVRQKKSASTRSKNHPKNIKKNRKRFQPWFRPFQGWITLEICSDLFLEYFYIKKNSWTEPKPFLLGEKKNASLGIG